MKKDALIAKVVAIPNAVDLPEDLQQNFEQLSGR